jgi:hypothetical protein
MYTQLSTSLQVKLVEHGLTRQNLAMARSRLRRLCRRESSTFKAEANSRQGRLFISLSERYQRLGKEIRDIVASLTRFNPVSPTNDDAVLPSSSTLQGNLGGERKTSLQAKPEELVTPLKEVAHVSRAQESPALEAADPTPPPQVKLEAKTQAKPEDVLPREWDTPRVSPVAVGRLTPVRPPRDLGGLTTPELTALGELAPTPLRSVSPPEAPAESRQSGLAASQLFPPLPLAKGRKKKRRGRALTFPVKPESPDALKQCIFILGAHIRTLSERVDEVARKFVFKDKNPNHLSRTDLLRIAETAIEGIQQVVDFKNTFCGATYPLFKENALWALPKGKP